MNQQGSSQRPRKLGRGLADVAHVFLSASEDKPTQPVDQPEFWLIRNKIMSVTSGEDVRGKTLLAFALSLGIVRLGRSAALVSPDHDLLKAALGRICSDAQSAGESVPINLPRLYSFPQIDDGVIDSKANTEWVESACREAGFVIIDTPPDASLSLKIWKLCDLVIVLTEPSTRKMQSSYATIKRIVNANKNSRIGLVVNMARGYDEAEKCFRKMSSATRNFMKVNLRNYGFMPFAELLVDLWQGVEPFGKLDSFGMVARGEQIARSILMDESAIARRGKEVTVKPCV